MPMPAARVGDFHMCPMVTPPGIPHVGGPILPPGVPTVLIMNMPAAPIGNPCVCVGPPDSTLMGSATVMVGNRPLVRILQDPTAHGGMIMVGAFTVIVGP